MDLATNFNNLGVQLHRLQRYEEAEEMFKGAVQVLLHSKANMLLSHQQSSRCEIFDALVDGDQTHQAAAKMDGKTMPSASNPDDDVDMLQDIPVQETSSSTPTSVETSNHSSQATSLLVWPSTPFQQDGFQEGANHPRPQEGSSGSQIPLPHSQQPPAPFSSPTSSSSPSVVLEAARSSLLRSKRDEYSVYMCLDAIQLDASTLAKDTIDASMTSSPSTSACHADDTNDICRYDIETIVVLYNMALTLQCLDQLTLSCYIYDLADRVLCGQPKEKVLKDPLACKLVLAICNNLGQIFMETGHWEMARAYINRLADFLLAMDPPSNAEQAKERLEFVLNIYWFDNPPSAASA